MLISPNPDSAADSEVRLDLTPIIDMVFLLLIFFLVATTFAQAEREIEVALPVARNAEPLSATLRELVINVKQDGAIVVAGRALSADDLRAMLTESAKINPDRKVTVRGDRRATYDHVVQVLDLCKAAGIQQPYLDTRATD